MPALTALQGLLGERLQPRYLTDLPAPRTWAKHMLRAAAITGP